MTSNIVNPEEIVPSKNFIYSKPKPNSNGGKTVYIMNSTTRKSLQIYTPLMMTWGVSEFDDKYGKKYSMSLQFPREEFSNNRIQSFFTMLKDMETQLKADALKYSMDWFGKQLTKEGIDLIWNPMLKYPKDKSTGEPDTSRQPSLKVNFPVWEGECNFDLFDMDNNLLIPNENKSMPTEFIEKQSQIACILQCGGLWFANNSFGVTWKLKEGQVEQAEKLERGVCHCKIEKEEKERLKKNSEIDNEEVINNDVVVESDDEEDDEEEETEQEETPSPPEEEPQPQPPSPPEEKPKKKRVVKKKT